jgi:predicted porin
MKKSLVALAVLAASGATMAQSSVTMYGIVDLYMASLSVTDQPSQLNMLSGGVSGSRWGLKGSEDLGGGLKANFTLEQGFSADTGAAGGLANSTTTGAAVAGNAAFSRYAYVGLSGGFGEVKFGKTGTAYDDVNGASNGVFDSALSPTNGSVAGVFRSTNYNWNPANTLYYTSPSMGGVTGTFSYTLGEDKGPAVNASSITSFNVQYAGGPVAAQLAYQKEDVQTSTNDTAYTRLGASYDLGVAKLMGSYGKVANVANVSGADTTEYQFGVDYPLASNMVLSGSFAHSSDNKAAGDATRKGYGFGLAYILSKRTTAYGGFVSGTTTPKVGADTTTKALAVGLKHTF